MSVHLNGCMLLGFRSENKNETLELLYPESRRRNEKDIENNYYVLEPIFQCDLFARVQFFGYQFMFRARMYTVL